MTRATIVHQGCPDYLMDIVTDGFIRKLGRQNLHIAYNEAFPPDYIRARLYESFRIPNTFDFIEGDLLVISPRSDITLMQEWIKRSPRKDRIAVVDGEDDETIRDNYREGAKVYYKREVSNPQIRPNVKPLPFGAFPEEMPPSVPRTRPAVFMGEMRGELRRKIYDHLKAKGIQDQEKGLNKDAYNEVLASARIGVSVRGAGWDTYRYWETPYFGCALLAQRPRIAIPNNFKDNEEAVFFDTFEEFQKQLDALMGDEARTAKLGVMGQMACLTKHLSTHRAETILEDLQ